MGQARIKYHRDYEPLVAAALEQGWTLDATKKGHPRLSPPPGLMKRDGSGPARPCTIPSTPGDYRSLRNCRSEFRQQGLIL